MANLTDMLNSFLLEFKEASIPVDAEMFERTANGVQAGKMINVLSLNPQIYTKYIDNSIDSIKDIASSSAQLDTFFSNVYKSAYIDDKRIAIPLQDSDEIEKIRPDYLTSIPAEFDSAVKKILAGQKTFDDVAKDYVYGKFFPNIKKSIVKSKLAIDDPKDLMKLSSPSLVKVDSVFLQSSAIPFFRSFSQNVNDIIVLATNTKGKINESYRALYTSINALRNLDNTDPNVIRTLNFLSINFMKQFMDICAYTTAILIRKISFLTFNNASYTNLYNMMYNYFPEGELVLHESVLNGDITDIDDSVLLNSILDGDLNIVIPHIQKVINLKKIELANLISKKFNFKINFDQDIDSAEYQYNISAYDTAVKMLMDIAKSLTNFHNKYRDDEPVDEIIEESGLSEPFAYKYQDQLTKILDISFYDNEVKSLEELTKSDDRLRYLSIYNDLAHYQRNMTIIANNARKIYQFLLSFQDEMNVNNYQIDVNRFNEVKSFVDTLMTRYKEFALHLTKKLLSRLDSLTDAIEDADIGDDWSIPESYVPWDYSVASYQEAYEDLELQEKELFEEMARDLIVRREQESTGMTVVFEAEKTEGDSAAPTVQTDADKQNVTNAQQPAQPNTQQNTQQNAQQNGSTKASESMIQKFKNFIDTILEKFLGKVRQLAGKNNKWLASVKSGIQNLDYTDTKITAAAYPNLTGERISQDIQGAVNKINAINIDNLPKELIGRNAKAEFYLFQNIPERIDGTSSFSERVKHFYTFGSDKKNTLVTYAGDEAKAKVADMIAYCEGYDNMCAKIESDIRKLTKAATDKQQKIATNKSASATTESVMMEANAEPVVTQNGQKVKQNPNDVKRIDNSNVVTGICRDYAAAILTVAEKKYLDYIKILNRLVPSNVTPQENATKTGAEAEKAAEEAQNAK